MWHNRRDPEPHASACAISQVPKTSQELTDINVAAITQTFGARIRGTLAEMRQKIIDSLESVCNKCLVSGSLRMILEDFLPDGGFYFPLRSIFGILNAYGPENPSR